MKNYPTNMLPTIDYAALEEDSIFGDDVVTLEYDVMRELSKYVEELKEEMLKERLVQTPELMITHLCAYLGFFSLKAVGLKESLNLQPHIEQLLKRQAKYAVESFNQHPVNSIASSKEQKNSNLEQVRSNAPGSIVVQTIRLGRVIYDIMEELRYNYPSIHPPKKLFCQQDVLINMLKTMTMKNIKKWKKEFSHPILFVINHITVQIGWLMGYYAHLDNAPADGYLSYGLPCVGLYIEFGDKYSKALKAKRG